MRPFGQSSAFFSPYSRREEQPILHAWNRLREVIEDCGGQVTVLPASVKESLWRNVGLRPNDLRSSMFVRDPGFMLYPNGQAAFFSANAAAPALRSEAQAIRRALHDPAKAPLKGHVDGGNLVYDAHRNILFWGVSNAEHVTQKAALTQKYPALLQAGKLHAYDVNNRIKLARPMGDALKQAGEAFSKEPMLEKDGQPFRIVPIFIPDGVSPTFYHLDGVFGMLPSGEAIVCEELLGRAARRALEKTIGKEHIFLVSENEARAGATNFITVGNHVITPYASKMLKHYLAERGYDVIDPPAAGLPHDAWMFGPMGAVRCATLKVTEDMGFPAAQAHVAKAAGRS